MIWGERKAIDSDPSSATYGLRQWETYFLLNCLVSLKPVPFEDSAIGETVWSVTANNASRDQYGRAMSEAIHGCTEAAFVLIKSKDRYWYDCFVGDGSQATFNLTKLANTVYATATQPVLCFVNGVVRSVSVSAGGVATPTPAVGDEEKIVVESEYTS